MNNAKKKRKTIEWKDQRPLQEIGDIKGTIPAEISTIKDRNCKDLKEAKKIKKRWRCQEYTEELYKKGLNDLDNHNSVVTHLEPGILECKVKCNLGSISLNKIQFSSVTQLCPTLCNPMNCSMPGLHVHHELLEFTQTHVHQVGDAIQPFHPLSSPSPPALNPSQHQGLFQ